MAQDQALNSCAQQDRPVKSRSVMSARIPMASKRGRHVAHSYRLESAVAEALFDVHRLEAIVEDLVVVVASLSRVTGGMGAVAERLDHLEQTFGARQEDVRSEPPCRCPSH